MSDSLVRVSRRVEWGARWPTPRARRCHEGTSVRSRATLLLVTETTIRWAGSSARLGRPADSAGRRRRSRRADRSRRPRDNDRWRIAAPIRFPPEFQALFDSFFQSPFHLSSQGTCSLSVSRRYLAFDGIYRLFGLHSQTTRLADKRRRDRVRAQRVVTLSGAPHSMGLAPVRPQRTLLQTTPTGEKPPILILGSSRSPPLLLGESFGCSHLTWGRIRARPPGHGGNCRQGSFQSQGLGHDFEPRRAREGGATTVAAGRPLGQNSMVRGILQFTPSIAISPRSSSMREPRYPLSRVVRLPCSRSDRQGFFFAWHRSPPKVVVRGVRPDRRWPLTLSPPGAGSLTPGEGIRRALRLAAAAAAGHRGAARSLGRAASRESTMILPQVQWTSQRYRAANRQRRRRSNTSPTIQSVGATGGVYKGQGRSQRELMTRATRNSSLKTNNCNDLSPSR
ncbi:hypothetical protein H6P81_021210 [Aristolochia fimbriata]|uniref:Uncharacterized protein n=1 Tax=Aristolochia fimbriata TaxID=158543 RepID=A0AAV7DRX0_ARIFI|nr:hypothetical protein H6P81_021210 [Aristolochia fimbriata]